MQMPHSSWSHRGSPIWIHLFRLLDWYPRDLDQERAFDPWILLLLIPHQHNCDRDHGSALPHFFLVPHRPPNAAYRLNHLARFVGGRLASGYKVVFALMYLSVHASDYVHAH
jgi:hypothetical protein